MLTIWNLYRETQEETNKKGSLRRHYELNSSTLSGCCLFIYIYINFKLCDAYTSICQCECCVLYGFS